MLLPVVVGYTRRHPEVIWNDEQPTREDEGHPAIMPLAIVTKASMYVPRFLTAPPPRVYYSRIIQV